jgi:hypothetical protein
MKSGAAHRGLVYSLFGPVKLPEKFPRVPRLSLAYARWRAVCGRCLAYSRDVVALTERDAWNEIAGSEGWCSYEPGEGFAPYPVCLKCADAMLDDDARRLVK